jgi:hypothetical protein
MSLLLTVTPMLDVSVSTAGSAEPLTLTVWLTSPTAIFTVRELACSGINSRWSRVCVWKPCLVAVRVNTAAGSALKLNTPLASLVRTMVSLVAVFLSVSVAPGISAPSESVTTPWTDVRNCAAAGTVSRRAANASRPNFASRRQIGALRLGCSALRGERVFMVPP